MTKIKWSAEALQEYQDTFYDRVKFHPPAPKVPSGKTVPDYLATLSDEDFLALGHAVHTETDGLVNGWPMDDLIKINVHRLRQKYSTHDGSEPYSPDKHFPQYKDMLKFEDTLETIGKVGSILLDGPSLEGDKKQNQQILMKKLFGEYDAITKIGTEYSDGLQKDWSEIVNQTAYHVLNYSGHATKVYWLYGLLKAELKRRRPPLTAKQLAEEQEAAKENELAFFGADDWVDDGPEMSDEDVERMMLEEELGEQKQKVFAYEAILKEMQSILASKATLEEKHAALEKTLHTSWLYAELSETEVNKSLARPHVTQRYKDAVYKLNGIPNIKGKTFTASFKPHDQDGSIGNGHSKQMLALRTGIVIDYDSKERLKFTVHRRRRNDGNDVDCEIHDGDKRVQAIVTLECDERDDFVVVTIKTYENKYWQQAEENLLRKNYKRMRQPVSWFADWYPKLCEEAARLIELDDQKMEKKGQG